MELTHMRTRASCRKRSRSCSLHSTTLQAVASGRKTKCACSHGEPRPGAWSLTSQRFHPICARDAPRCASRARDDTEPRRALVDAVEQQLHARQMDEAGRRRASARRIGQCGREPFRGRRERSHAGSTSASVPLHDSDGSVPRARTPSSSASRARELPEPYETGDAACRATRPVVRTVSVDPAAPAPVLQPRSIRARSHAVPARRNAGRSGKGARRPRGARNARPTATQLARARRKVRMRRERLEAE